MYWLTIFELAAFLFVIIAAVAGLGGKNNGMAFLVVMSMSILGYLLHVPYFNIDVVIIVIMIAAAILAYGMFLKEDATL